MSVLKPDYWANGTLGKITDGHCGPLYHKIDLPSKKNVTINKRKSKKYHTK